MNIIATFDKIEELIADLKEKNKKIAFTNGCFDILHRGHVEYLEKAKEKADILVLGLNSDASVRRLKGDKRPYVSENDRAFILSRLEAVDIVCIFSEDTPINLLYKVKPDYLIKGGDYQLDQIVGREFVESYGGKVVTIPVISGKSTTNLVERIKTSRNYD